MERFKIEGRLLLVLLLMVASSLADGQDAAPGKEEAKTAAVIMLEGIIDPQLEQFVYRKLKRAQSQNVDVVIIQIDSPGGYRESSFNLADRFRSIDWATCVAYVPREALSGASIAALGCDQIIVDEDARFGDAGPVYATFDGTFRYVPEKLRSHLAQHMRVLAKAHDRPQALAEALVDSDLKVYEFRHRETGEQQFFSSRELKNVNEDQWERVREVPESGDGRFLEVTGSRAVELGLADDLANDRDEILAKLNIDEPPAVYRPGTVELIIGILNHPLMTAILFVAGLIALYLELSSPGIGLGGSVATLCFGLFFWSRFLGGTAGWLELILFVAGVGFLLLEVFVIPGFGISGITGLGLIVVSLILASQEFVMPQTSQDTQRLLVSLTVVVASGFLFLSCAVVITRHFGKLPVLSRLVLTPPTSPAAAPTPEKASKFELLQAPVTIGDIGIAESALRPAGKAVFGEAYVDVVADGSFVDSGHMVRVVQISGNRVVVREVEGKPPVA